MAFHPLTSLRVFGVVPGSEPLFTANIGVDKQESRQTTTRSLAFTLPRWKVKVTNNGVATSQAAQFSRKKVADAVPFLDGTTPEKFVKEVHGFMPNLPKFLAKMGLTGTSEVNSKITFKLDEVTGLPVEAHGLCSQREFVAVIQSVMDVMSQDMILDCDEHLIRLVAGSKPFAQLKATESELDTILDKWVLMRANDNQRVIDARCSTTAAAIYATLKDRAATNGLSSTGFVNMKKPKGEVTSLGEEDYWDLMDEDDSSAAPNNTEANPDTTSPTA